MDANTPATPSADRSSSSAVNAAPTSTEPPALGWRWTPSGDPEASASARRWLIGGVLALIAIVGWAALAPSRFSIVIAVIALATAGLNAAGHQRWRTFFVEVDAAGTLRFPSRSGTHEVRLADIAEIDVRSQPVARHSIAVFLPSERWMLSAAGAAGALAEPLPQAAGLGPLPDVSAERLRERLQAARDAAAGTRPPAATSDALRPDTAGAGAATHFASVADDANGSAETLRGGRFEWRPPVHPSVARRDRWFLIAGVGAPALLAIGVALTTWRDDGSAVDIAMSAIPVPGFLILCAVGWLALRRRMRRFEVVVDNGVLQVSGLGAPKSIPLSGATVTVDAVSSTVYTGSTTSRVTSKILRVQAPDGSELRQQLPQIGVRLSEEACAALEFELRRRT